MGKRHTALTEQHIDFISCQKIFFVGTAVASSRVNISPKGMNSFKVLGKNRALWLNVTGSGNETAAHIQHESRMTVMFCAFEGSPLILRLYGNARVIHRNDADWDELFALLEPIPGARQIFDLSIDLVQTSCGTGVPLYSFEGDRNFLPDWAGKKGNDGLRQYWEEKNRFSLDQIPTNILEKNA